MPAASFCSLRLVAQDTALSRREQGFETPRERQFDPATRLNCPSDEDSAVWSIPEASGLHGQAGKPFAGTEKARQNPQYSPPPDGSASYLDTEPI